MTRGVSLVVLPRARCPLRLARCSSCSCAPRASRESRLVTAAPVRSRGSARAATPGSPGSCSTWPRPPGRLPDRDPWRRSAPPSRSSNIATTCAASTRGASLLRSRSSGARSWSSCWCPSPVAARRGVHLLLLPSRCRARRVGATHVRWQRLGTAVVATTVVLRRDLPAQGQPLAVRTSAPEAAIATRSRPGDRHRSQPDAARRRRLSSTLDRTRRASPTPACLRQLGLAAVDNQADIHGE